MVAKKLIYLDYAAATPTDDTVLQKMLPFFSDNFYNPSATYQAGLNTQQALSEARAQIAHWLGSRSSEIIFTAGGSEANNLAIHGIMRNYPDAHIVVSAVEHESVLGPAERYEHTIATVMSDGRIDVEALVASITESTVLVSAMQANNEVGTVQPIREISNLVAKIRRQRQADGNTLPLYLHTDACQAANYLDLHVARLGVDLLTINGSKIYGPKQVGALYVKGGIKLQPLIDGGGQERGLRSGTENVAGAVGLAVALDIAQQSRQSEIKRLKSLQQQFLDQLEEQLPNAAINGSRKQRLPNNVHITIPGHDNERLLIQLDESGIMAAAGSACSASNEAPSHVLSAMGLSDEAARASLRFTMGRGTVESDITRTVLILKKLTQKS